jgi:hypothetical protein
MGCGILGSQVLSSLAGGSATLAARGFDEAVDLAVSALDVGL